MYSGDGLAGAGVQLVKHRKIKHIILFILTQSTSFAEERLTVCVTGAGADGETPSDVENDKA